MFNQIFIWQIILGPKYFVKTKFCFKQISVQKVFASKKFFLEVRKF